MGCGSSELPGTGIFCSVKKHAVQAAYRTKRRNPYGHDGKEPNAILSRTDGLSGRRKTSGAEIVRYPHSGAKAGASSLFSGMQGEFFLLFAPFLHCAFELAKEVGDDRHALSRWQSRIAG